MSLFQTFSCDDGALYYVRQIDQAFFWFAEHKQRGFSSIFHGKRVGDLVTGELIACCKGQRKVRGTLSLTLIDNDRAMVLNASSGTFTGRNWNACVVPLAQPARPRIAPDPNDHGDGQEPAAPLPAPVLPCQALRATALPVRAGFQGEGKDDLTGTWRGDDGFFYYVTQFGQRVAWMGEKPGACHVFIGTRENVVIDDLPRVRLKGRRVDLPKATAQGDETVQYLLRDHPRIGSGVLDRESGALSTTLARYEQLDVEIKLDTLRLDKTDERRDEPFLWSAFVKVDGDTVDARGLRDTNDAVFLTQLFETLRDAAPQVSSLSGSHHNLGGPDRVDEGTTVVVPLPAGRFATSLRTITGLDPNFVLDLPNVDGPTTARDLTGMGMVVVAWEQDGFKDETIEIGRAALVKSIRDGVDDQIARGELKNFSALESQVAAAVDKAIRENIGVVLNPDDMLGFLFRQFSFAELRQGDITIDHTFTGDDKHPVAYRLRGAVRVN